MIASWDIAPLISPAPVEGSPAAPSAPVPPPPPPPPKSDRMIAASPSPPVCAARAPAERSVAIVNRFPPGLLFAAFRAAAAAAAGSASMSHAVSSALSGDAPSISFAVRPPTPPSSSSSSSASSSSASATSAARISPSTSANNSAVSICPSPPTPCPWLSSSHVNKSARSFALKNRRCFGSFRTLDVRNSLYICLWYTFSSIVPAVTKRYTVTSRVCPIRHARSRACASVLGFQSGSYSNTRSAPVKLTPRPPTFVVNKNTNTFASVLNSSMSVMRCDTGVAPSILRYGYPAFATIASRISNICCVCEKSKTRCPCSFHSSSTFCVTSCLPLRSTSPYFSCAAFVRRSSKSG
eukprot:28616-Pelagococcus_subviridis.AAC.2